MKQVIEIPISIGDVVYFKFPWDYGENDVHIGTVSSIHISINRKGVCTKSFRVSYEYVPGYKDTHDFQVSSIGTYVFFTKEEAEAVEVGSDD